MKKTILLTVAILLAGNLLFANTNTNTIHFSSAADSLKVPVKVSKHSPELEKAVFTIGAQIRPRFEYRHGFKKPLASDLDPASFVEQRSRIWLDYKAERFQIHINFQDVRMWGSTNQIYKSDPSMFNIYEAYGVYKFSKRWGVKVGRQAIDYDNARFFGNLDWAQQGRSHDAFVITYNNQTSGFALHAGIAYNQYQIEPKYLSYQPYTNNNYKVMYYAWGHKAWDKASVSFLFNNDGREKEDSKDLFNRQTIAAIPSFTFGNVKMDAEAFYQFGKNPKGQKVNAYLLAFRATLRTSLTPITLGVDLASGTAYDADADVDNSWNPLYGTNHKFYGFMDYFYVGNPHGQFGRNSGLIDLFAKTKFNLSANKKHSLLAHLHYFRSPVAILDLTDPYQDKTLDKYLGTEIDLVYTYKFGKGIAGNLGYSQMFASDSMKHIKGMDSIADGVISTGTNNWVWVQINFSSDLFKF